MQECRYFNYLQAMSVFMNTPSQQPTMARVDWRAAVALLRGKISEEEQRIVDLLAAGKSTPDIAKALGTNRSAVWRKVQRIKNQLPERG